MLMAIVPSAGAQQPPRNESPRTVTLALTEYNRLIDLANPPPSRPAVAPVAAVLASADLRVRVDRDTARGVFTLAGDVLRDGVNRVHVLSGGTLVDASSGGRPVPLIAEANAHLALLPGPGAFSLALEWGALLKFVPGRASFVLPVPPAGTARATIDLPGELADVRVSAGLVTRRSTAAGRTIVEATLDPGSATEVWWSMRDSAPVAAVREARTLANVLTLVTLGDSDVRMVTFIDLSIVQGEPRTIDVRLPSGYEVTSITSSSLETSERRADGVTLTIGDPTTRRHQLLIGLERQHEGGSFALDTGFVTLSGVQRERGEIAVEGIGALELTATEREGMHRIDVRELNPSLQSLARLPLLTAFRYQESAVAPGLELDVKRFADVGVLAAVADHAVATTLVTSEGRALTEIHLLVQNRAQPFLKVTLPPGASIVSVDVAGKTAKPVLGTDGTRVPLMRPGFRPKGTYPVSFVYLHPGTPFARKGEMQMTLPAMDIPIGLINWELFVPETYSVRAVGGNVIDQRAMRRVDRSRNRRKDTGRKEVTSGVGGGIAGGIAIVPATKAERGQILGRVIDTSGGVLPGVMVVLESDAGHLTAITRADGTFLIEDVPSGAARMTAQLAGFRTQSRSVMFDQKPLEVEFVLPVGAVEETVT
ncbi:MAG: carboxypeptidase-like regulatory domain-containing protein, partial [Vicinamibacterales bacterium]